MKMEIIILAGLGLLIAILGTGFIDGFPNMLAKIFGLIIWASVTFTWWWYPLCDKWFKQT